MWGIEVRASTLSYRTFEFLNSLCIFCSDKLLLGKCLFWEQQRKLRIVMMDKTYSPLPWHAKWEHQKCLSICVRMWEGLWLSAGLAAQFPPRMETWHCKQSFVSPNFLKEHPGLQMFLLRTCRGRGGWCGAISSVRAPQHRLSLHWHRQWGQTAFCPAEIQPGQICACRSFARAMPLLPMCVQQPCSWAGSGAGLGIEEIAAASFWLQPQRGWERGTRGQPGWDVQKSLCLSVAQRMKWLLSLPSVCKAQQREEEETRKGLWSSSIIKPLPK